MFDMFTSRNVKKIFKYPLSRPTTMSDQIVGLRECWLSNLSNILGRNMSDLRVWSLIHLECTVAIFHITELLKHSRPGVHLKPIELKHCTQDKHLCVVTALEVYIHRTAHLRNNNSFLFISYLKPYNRLIEHHVIPFLDGLKMYCVYLGLIQTFSKLIVPDQLLLVLHLLLVFL